VLVCSERKVLLAGCWCWFVLREKYCWLVADKPSEQGVALLTAAPELPDQIRFLPLFFERLKIPASGLFGWLVVDG
jgi:hypothetical protein